MFSEQIKQAVSEHRQLQIVGNESKAKAKQGFDILNLSEHQGIVEYQPEELLITVKAGTTLKEINQVLSKNNQYLPFEPPEFGNSSIGGSYACAMSGSSTPFVGFLRDYVLGVKIINGLGETLTFGGQMVKNVAGYDVSRLLVGSAGNFSIIDEISFKVLPKPKEQTYKISISEQEAIVLMNQWAGTALPLSACAYYKNYFYYRLSVPHNKQSNSKTDEQIWQTLNPFKIQHKSHQKLWKLSVKSTQPTIENTVAIDHCGIRRWVLSDEEPDNHNKITPAIEKLTQKLKLVFDPQKIFISNYAN